MTSVLAALAWPPLLCFHLTALHSHSERKVFCLLWIRFAKSRLFWQIFCQLWANGLVYSLANFGGNVWLKATGCAAQRGKLNASGWFSSGSGRNSRLMSWKRESSQENLLPFFEPNCQICNVPSKNSSGTPLFWIPLISPLDNFVLL